jgi:hypothetical protein
MKSFWLSLGWLGLFAYLVCLPGLQRSLMAASTPQTKQPARTERLVVSYAGEDGKSALELLKQKARVKTQRFSFGELVVEINGVRSGKGYDFLYYVNGGMVKMGAADYVTQTGEKIEWKLVGPRPTAAQR